jgi:hypothetical protein
MHFALLVCCVLAQRQAIHPYQRGPFKPPPGDFAIPRHPK